MLIAVAIVAVGVLRLVRYPPYIGRRALLATTHVIGTMAAFWFVF